MNNKQGIFGNRIYICGNVILLFLSLFKHLNGDGSRETRLKVTNSERSRVAHKSYLVRKALIKRKSKVHFVILENRTNLIYNMRTRQTDEKI